MLERLWNSFSLVYNLRIFVHKIIGLLSIANHRRYLIPRANSFYQLNYVQDRLQIPVRPVPRSNLSVIHLLQSNDATSLKQDIGDIAQLFQFLDSRQYFLPELGDI